jgi:hypothetical protein
MVVGYLSMVSYPSARIVTAIMVLTGAEIESHVL